MSLDQNLFTLNITPKPNEPLIVELIDSKGTVHYRKERVDPQLKNGLYEFNMIGVYFPWRCTRPLADGDRATSRPSVRLVVSDNFSSGCDKQAQDNRVAQSYSTCRTQVHRYPVSLF